MLQCVLTCLVCWRLPPADPTGRQENAIAYCLRECRPVKASSLHNCNLTTFHAAPILARSAERADSMWHAQACTSHLAKVRHLQAADVLRSLPISFKAVIGKLQAAQYGAVEEIVRDVVEAVAAGAGAASGTEGEVAAMRRGKLQANADIFTGATLLPSVFHYTCATQHVNCS